MTMNRSDELYKVMDWRRRLDNLLYEPGQDDMTKGKIALIFFIAGILTGIIIMQYIIPLIQIYL